MNKRTYPGYPEYILLDLVPPTEVRFKRGAGEAMIFHPEFEVWQRYFSSPDYTPPEGKDILLFHTCTWSKPYDFSFIGATIRSVTDRFPRVHRVILSNAGVVPYEYQLNPTFCAYDYKPMEELSKESLDHLRSVYVTALADRIRNYITAHKDWYRAVVFYGVPVRNGLIERVYAICRELQIPFFHAPHVNTYRNLKAQLAALRDAGEFYTLPGVLADLTAVLERVMAYVEPRST